MTPDQNTDHSSADKSDRSSRPLTRAERIEAFDKETVEQAEWSAEQSQKVRAIVDDVLDHVAERHDIVISQTGTTVRENGKHEGRFKFHVAGDPLQPEVDE